MAQCFNSGQDGAGLAARTKEELVAALNREISETLVSTDWNFSQNIRNNVNETLSGVRGDNSVKIIGPDLVELENTADRVIRALRKVRGLENVGAFPSSASRT